MALVLFLAALIWGVGIVMKAPIRMRWTMIGVLYLAVLLAQTVLPDGNPLRAATGGSAAPWLLLGGFVLLAGIYSAGLRWLKARAQPAAMLAGTPPRPASFTEPELERYARHIVLRELGGPGQKRLHNARVLVIGAGGLGSPALLYLAAAGVGTIGVIDDDVVENANLQRQVIHRDGTIGMPKVFSAQQAMLELNPNITVKPYQRRLSDEIAAELFSEFDLVLDGTDNFDTRYLANRAAVAAQIPLISGALSQWEGQISVFDPANGAPCYQCIFPEAPAPGLAPSCAAAGVLGPLPGVIGTMMAVEAVKVLAGAGEPLRGRMMIYDALYAETRQINLSPRADCPVCGGGSAG